MTALATLLRLGRLAVSGISPLGAYVHAAFPLVGPLVAWPMLAFIAARLIAPPGPAALYGIVALVLALLALADIGKGFALDGLTDELRRRALECRTRVAAVRIRRSWSAMCTALGWDHLAVNEPRTRTRGARRGPEVVLRRPALRHVEVARDRIRLAFRPRADQAPQEYPSLVDALRRYLGGHSAAFHEHPDEPGTLACSFGLTALPVHEEDEHDNASASGPGSPDVVGPREPELSLTSSRRDSGSGHFVLGPRAGGGVAAWRPEESPHMLVVGATGGGKGGLIRLVCRDALEAGWDVRCVDMKGAGDYRWAAERDVPVARTIEEALTTLRWAAREVKARSSALWTHGADRVGALPEAERPAPVLVVVDEAADLLLLRKVGAEKRHDELRSEAGSLLSVIASQGRAAGVHLVVAIQRPDISLLGPAGGFLRDNLTSRVGLGRLSVEGADMLFGSGYRDETIKLTGTPGRALASHLAAGEVHPYAFQTKWLAPHRLWSPNGAEVPA